MNQSRAYMGACLMALAGILFWVLVMPLYDRVSMERATLAEHTALIDTRTQILANVDDLSQQYATRASDIQRFAAMVPAQKSSPELVSSIEALASQNGLQLTRLSLSGASNQNTDPYNSQSIDMSLAGSYPSFKSFLMALEKNIRIIDITTINASPAGDNLSIITFGIKGNAYYLK